MENEAKDKISSARMKKVSGFVILAVISLFRRVSHSSHAGNTPPLA
jgi:hypothetical protein